jgi:hypothetical protein
MLSAAASLVVDNFPHIRVVAEHLRAHYPNNVSKNKYRTAGVWSITNVVAHSIQAVSPVSTSASSCQQMSVLLFSCLTHVYLGWVVGCVGSGAE